MFFNFGVNAWLNFVNRGLVKFLIRSVTGITKFQVGEFDEVSNFPKSRIEKFMNSRISTFWVHPFIDLCELCPNKDQEPRTPWSTWLRPRVICEFPDSNLENFMKVCFRLFESTFHWTFGSQVSIRSRTKVKTGDLKVISEFPDWQLKKFVNSWIRVFWL